jgi:hypothetical protein
VSFAYILTNILSFELPLNFPLQPNVPNGQAGTGNPSASFPVTDQPPTWYDRHPNVFARPDAQGIPAPVTWRLIYASIDYEDGDDLRVVIHFRKIRSL